MKITAVENGATAQEAGLKVGDELLSINGHPVRDVLDYRFLVADEQLEIEVLTSQGRVVFEIEKEYDDDLGIGFDDIEIRSCGNDCPFCFVDQNPAGMRQSMYFRDEDFRLSFLSGHYVTLTNLSKRDMDRIVWQQLSPLFVSVHATEPAVRRFLFGIEHDDKLLAKLEFLTKNGIEVHTQVVLCPGINDGAVLKKTVDELSGFLPNLRSVSVVPVGLTKHRNGLKKLDPVTPAYARNYLNIIDGYAGAFQCARGEYFVYAGDEFYLMANVDLPGAERYDGFYQVENGVGMLRYTLDAFQQQKFLFPASLSAPATATLVTAMLVGSTIAGEILPSLNHVGNFKADLAIIPNEFYGNSIHVTGLLTGQDIFQALSRRELGDRVYLPANCLKDDSVFLDDWTIAELSAKLRRPVIPLHNDFTKIFETSEWKT